MCMLMLWLMRKQPGMLLVKVPYAVFVNSIRPSISAMFLDCLGSTADMKIFVCGHLERARFRSSLILLAISSGGA